MFWLVQNQKEEYEVYLKTRFSSTMPISMFFPDIWPSNLQSPQLHCEYNLFQRCTYKQEGAHHKNKIRMEVQTRES